VLVVGKMGSCYKSPPFAPLSCACAQPFWRCHLQHSDDILGARMLWKPKEARILKNFIDQPV